MQRSPGAYVRKPCVMEKLGLAVKKELDDPRESCSDRIYITEDKLIAAKIREFFPDFSR